MQKICGMTTVMVLCDLLKIDYAVIIQNTMCGKFLKDQISIPKEFSFCLSDTFLISTSHYFF